MPQKGRARRSAVYSKWEQATQGSANWALYQRCGFSIESIEKDYFVRHYPDPIYENGIECRDMVRLRMEL